MRADDVAILRDLKAHRTELIGPAIAEYTGRIVKTMSTLLPAPSCCRAEWTRAMPMFRSNAASSSALA
jgi:hypothetical protein